MSEPRGIAVSVIAPTDYLSAFATQSPASVHCIAAQRVLKSRRYRAFYCQQKEAGAVLVMDNGVFDLGESLPLADLARAARMIQADELILPDVLQNHASTIRASERAAIQLSRLNQNLKLCGVIQGATDSGWLKCYEHFSKASYISAIALPAPTQRTQVKGIAFDRVAATSMLEAQDLVNESVTYRLLGLGDAGHLELSIQRRHAWLSSVDTSAPVVLGALGQLIISGQPYHKPTLRVDDIPRLTARTANIVKRNILTIRAAAGCSISLI